MNFFKAVSWSMLMFLLISCESDQAVVGDIEQIKSPVQAEKPIEKADKSEVKLSKTAQIDLEIRRIEEKLKTNPTVKGWILVGDAHMHLKRYKEAAGAYNDAYMLSGLAPEPRKKLKRAMYYVGLEKANGVK